MSSVVRLPGAPPTTGCCRWPRWSTSGVGWRSTPAPSGSSWTVLDLVGRLGQLKTDGRRVGRFNSRDYVKVTTSGSPLRGPDPVWKVEVDF